ncbi:MAG: RsmD family RNA methyltransferase, partial [Clostridia bacterium]|nr:RsmD family RNA methyltransferase [Clostridia bacterium]
TFLNATKMKFDIVFLDPPYKTDYGIKAIEILIEKKLLNDNAIIIFETSDENNFNLNFAGFEITKKKYGKIVVFKMVKVQ